MKIAVKKKYLAGLAFLVSGVLGMMFFGEIVKYLSDKSLLILIPPFIFIVSIVYIVHFFTSLYYKGKISEEVSNDIEYNLQEREMIKKHLDDLAFEEAYTLNFSLWNIKFTSSWDSQKQFEKNNTKQTPMTGAEMLMKGLKRGLAIKPKHSPEERDKIFIENLRQGIRENLKKQKQEDSQKMKQKTSLEDRRQMMLESLQQGIRENIKKQKQKNSS